MVGQDNSNGSSRDHLRRVIKMVTVISSGPETRTGEQGVLGEIISIEGVFSCSSCLR